MQAAPVYWYDEIDSTSEEAKRRARAGETGPLWIAARQQTAGRGRLGREWSSPDGNLYTTLLFSPDNGLKFAMRIPFAAALAIVDACRVFTPSADFQLKWPNDVRVDGAKITGILVESGETKGVFWVALGIGVNVSVAPDIGAKRSTSLRDLGAHFWLQDGDVLEELQTTMSLRLEQARTDFEGTLRDWISIAEGLGQTVEAGPHDARISGTFEGLAEDGGLKLRLQDGTTRIIRAGDVELVRHVD